MIDVDIEQRLDAFELSVRFAVDAPIVGLFGRSGAGKTSVVNAIAGIAAPTRGVIRINDRVLLDTARGVSVPPERRRVGYVFQDPLLFPHRDVQANLMYGRNRCPPAERTTDPQLIVELLGLRALLHRRPATLSGGERQRVSIGRALLAQPRILLMDEPLAGLDDARKEEILAYVERLRDDLRIPIVYVSHSVDEIARLADVVVVLSDGRCANVGDVGTVMRAAAGTDVRYGDATGSLVETRVASHDSAHQLTHLAFDGGELVVPQLDVRVGERVRARILARDVSIATVRPVGISIVNILSAIVTDIRDDGGSSADVDLAVGASALTARVTRRSVNELGLRVGLQVHALAKAVSFEPRRSGDG